MLCIPQTPSKVTTTIKTPQGHDWVYTDRHGGSFTQAKCWRCGLIKQSWVESGWGLAVWYYPKGGGDRTSHEPCCVGNLWTPCTRVGGCLHSAMGPMIATFNWTPSTPNPARRYRLRANAKTDKRVCGRLIHVRIRGSKGIE